MSCNALVYIHVRNYPDIGDNYYEKNTILFYLLYDEGKMLTTLALFVLKLETMLLLETVLTLLRLLLL